MFPHTFLLASKFIDCGVGGRLFSQVPRVAMLFHNDCMFIAHNLLTLGSRHASRLPPALRVSSSSCSSDSSSSTSTSCDSSSSSPSASSFVLARSFFRSQKTALMLPFTVDIDFRVRVLCVDDRLLAGAVNLGGCVNRGYGPTVPFSWRTSIPGSTSKAKRFFCSSAGSVARYCSHFRGGSI